MKSNLENNEKYKMPGTAPKKEMYKEFDKRIKSFDFRASPPKITQWQKSSVVNDVYDIEMQQRFKSLEERLIYRMEVWIDVCRIETMNKGVLSSGAGKFHSTKRFRKTDSKLIKVRSFSLGKVGAKSVDDVTTIQNDKSNVPSDLPGPIKKRNAHNRDKSMSPAYSTSDLLDRRKTTEQEFNDITSKYGTGPKRKFRFFLFRKKDKNFETLTGSRKSKDKSKRNRHDSDENDNNNFALSSASQKLRPSLFDMESLKGSIPELAKLSLNSNIEVHEFDPRRKQHRNSTGENKFNTVQGTPAIPSKHETLFKASHNDSVRSKHKINKHKSNISNGPMFYDPQKKEAEIGNV